MSAHLPLMLLSEARSHQGQAHRCHRWSIHLSLKEPQAGHGDPVGCVCVLRGGEPVSKVGMGFLTPASHGSLRRGPL